MKDVFLSVIIPCFDEMANLQKGVLDHVNHFLVKKGQPFEVIIVDDGSTDGSIEFIEKYIKDNSNFSIIKNPHFGKAGAVTTGMLEATGRYRLFTDMDQATPIEEVEKLLSYLQKGDYDIAIGSRGDKRKGAPLIRLFVSRSAMFLKRYAVGIKNISDTQCGFKLFTNESAIDLFTRYKNIKENFSEVTGAAVTFGLDIEILYMAQKSQYKIKEVPVNWLFVESRRVNPIKDSIQGVIDLITIKRNAISGKYNSQIKD
ncbi:MAG TPA: glycosyltransferase [Candidatus Limnocylindrales bacterium]|nr:glycosyltransferase [Candidatus Limnocylindrales bacterium]